MPWTLFTVSFSAVNIINAYLLAYKPVLNYYVATGDCDYNQYSKPMAPVALYGVIINK